MRRPRRIASSTYCLLLAALLSGTVYADDRASAENPGSDGLDAHLLLESVNPCLSRSAMGHGDTRSWSSRFTLYDPPSSDISRTGRSLDAVWYDAVAGGRYGAGYSAADRTYPEMFFNGFKVVAATELALLAVMVALPREITKWEDDFVGDAAANLGTHLRSMPVWDQDDWALNYVGHPYAGSIYYNAIRSQGGTPFQGFLFSLFASTMWEYFIEGVAERPSTQDMLVTPIGGAILGEGIHLLTKKMMEGGTSFPEKVIITVLNPMSVVFRGYH